MNLEDAMSIARAYDRLHSLHRRIGYIDEEDRRNSNVIPDLYGSEINEPYSLDAAREIRAVMKRDLAAKLNEAMAALAALGVDASLPKDSQS